MHPRLMISTLIIHEGQPAVALPFRAMDELNLHAGQYVRIDVQPLASTPRMESSGAPGY